MVCSCQLSFNIPLLHKKRKNTVFQHFFFINAFKYIIENVINCNDKQFSIAFLNIVTVLKSSVRQFIIFYHGSYSYQWSDMYAILGIGSIDNYIFI